MCDWDWFVLEMSNEGQKMCNTDTIDTAPWQVSVRRAYVMLLVQDPGRPEHYNQSDKIEHHS